MSRELASMRSGFQALVLVVIGGAAALGCKAGQCEPELVDRAEGFLEAHQSCESDADCVIVSDFCGTLPNGYCGQLVMNREGKASAEWTDISDALNDCAPTECTVCLAARGVGCKDGSCGGP
jgi:hypothetical protein